MANIVLQLQSVYKDHNYTALNILYSQFAIVKISFHVTLIHFSIEWKVYVRTILSSTN